MSEKSYKIEDAVGDYITRRNLGVEGNLHRIRRPIFFSLFHPKE